MQIQTEAPTSPAKLRYWHTCDRRDSAARILNRRIAAGELPESCRTEVMALAQRVTDARWQAQQNPDAQPALDALLQTARTRMLALRLP